MGDKKVAFPIQQEVRALQIDQLYLEFFLQLRLDRLQLSGHGIEGGFRQAGLLHLTNALVHR